MGSGGMTITGLLGRLAPALTVAVAVVVSAVPWGLPSPAAFILPFVTAMLVFLHSCRSLDALPPWFVFLAGIATDTLTAGPIGYWALIYLLAHAIGRLSPKAVARQAYSDLWRVYALTAIATAAAAWGVASLYYVRLIDWRPMLIAAVAVVVLFPLIARFAGFRRRASLWAGE